MTENEDLDDATETDADNDTRPGVTDCPWCDAEDVLYANLSAGLKRSAGTRRPVIIHSTECLSCGAERIATVELSDLKRFDAVDTGTWRNVPGQQSLPESD